MSAARNPSSLASVSLGLNDTGISNARRLAVRAGGLTRVPQFEFEITENQRNYPRLPLHFPLRLRGVAGQPAAISEKLVTVNISSTGVLFQAPLRLEPNTPIELEIGLTDRPRGRERVRMRACAHVVRVDVASRPGWHTVAVTFDEILFDRDDSARSGSAN